MTAMMEGQLRGRRHDGDGGDDADEEADGVQAVDDVVSRIRDREAGR